MTTFDARKVSKAVVPYTRQQVWEVLADPAAVARLTPMVRGIEGHGDIWRWRLAPIEVLGKDIGLAFTERMDFAEPERIRFTHEPQGQERAGVNGTYTLTVAGSGTRLAIDLAVEVDLPFPRLARPAVTTSMQAVLVAMGAGFARQLDRHLSGS
jgi:carbon monoxide dehydrogenase subunit G